MRSVVFIAVCVLLAACGKNHFFSEDVTMDGQQWPAEKKLSFEVDVKDTLTYYDFFIDFRHNENYPYSDIYLFLTIDFPNGKNSSDTIHYIMQQGGAWLGKKSGSMIENHVLIKPKTKFPLTGKYKLHLQHGMRDEKLAGIEDAGICITQRD